MPTFAIKSHFKPTGKRFEGTYLFTYERDWYGIYRENPCLRITKTLEEANRRVQVLDRRLKQLKLTACSDDRWSGAFETVFFIADRARNLSLLRLFLALAVLASLKSGYCQDAGPSVARFGLARLTVRPMPGGLGELIAAELLRRHLPVEIVPSGRQADCVLALLPDQLSPNAVPASQMARLSQTIIMLDVHSRTIRWQKNLGSKDVNLLKTGAERRLASRVAGSISHDGAYCGGSTFSAPMEDMEDRVKAFKPPTFNW